MTHAVVTIEIDPKNRVDLALPLNVPSQALADAIIKALEVDKDGKKNYSLIVKTEGGLVRIPSQSTLGEAGVLDGFILQLSPEKSASASRKIKRNAYLETETGQTFALDADSMLIGRKDTKRGILVDIDLSPLDPRRIVTRKHAVLEKKKSQWSLTDLGSVNGTWLNGHKLEVHQSCPLQDGDEMVFGRNGVVLKFLNQK
jgi:hypothetical protein